jgi:colanic acid/amylovoran biosynthesis glycosyltransferase
MPCDVVVVHGGWGLPGGRGARPLYLDDRPIRSTRLPARVGDRGREIVLRRRGRNVIEELNSAAYLRAFRRARCDAVLVEFGHVAVRAMDACAALDLPLIAHFHGFDVHSRPLLERYGDRYPALFDQAAALVAVSHPMGDALQVLGAPPEKVHRVPYGVDVDRFAGAAPDRAPPTFLAVGRFVEKKAPQLTIAAFAALRQRHPEAMLRMVGEGELRPACQDLAQGLGLGDSVVFLGAQGHDVVATEMRQARAFVQHSLVTRDGDSEGMPVAILEASATGLPVVSTRHAGIPEVVVDGVTGLLVGERDVAGMTREMEHLVVDPGLAADLGRAGRRRIEQHFTIDESIERLWDIIRTAPAPSSGGPSASRTTPGATGA